LDDLPRRFTAFRAGHGLNGGPSRNLLATGRAKSVSGTHHL
jgi:hypothetical protein